MSISLLKTYSVLSKTFSCELFNENELEPIFNPRAIEIFEVIPRSTEKFVSKLNDLLFPKVSFKIDMPAAKFYY